MSGRFVVEGDEMQGWPEDELLDPSELARALRQDIQAIVVLMDIGKLPCQPIPGGRGAYLRDARQALGLPAYVEPPPPRDLVREMNLRHRELPDPSRNAGSELAWCVELVRAKGEPPAYAVEHLAALGWRLTRVEPTAGPPWVPASDDAVALLAQAYRSTMLAIIDQLFEAHRQRNRERIEVLDAELGRRGWKLEAVEVTAAAKERELLRQMTASPPSCADADGLPAIGGISGPALVAEHQRRRLLELEARTKAQQAEPAPADPMVTGLAMGDIISRITTEVKAQLLREGWQPPDVAGPCESAAESVPS